MRQPKCMKDLGDLGMVITHLDDSQMPQTSFTIMSEENPITVSSTESSPAPSHASSPESSSDSSIEQALQFVEHNDCYNANPYVAPIFAQFRIFRNYTDSFHHTLVGTSLPNLG